MEQVIGPQGFARRLGSALRVALIAMILLACVGCVPLSSESSPSTQELVIAAVKAAVPGSTNVLTTRSQSGASSGWAMEIDYPQRELSPDALAAVLHAVSAAAPDATFFTLIFYEAGTDNPIPISAAADTIGAVWSKYGEEGTWQAAQLATLNR